MYKREEQQARREASTIPSLQQDARSALGCVSNLAQSGIEGDLGLAAQADALKYERDAKVLTEDAAIEKRRMERESAIEKMEIEGAGAAAADAAEAQAAALGSAVSLGGDIFFRLSKQT